MSAVGIWAPPQERSFFVGTLMSGPSMGTFLVYPLVGAVIGAWGWEACFYVVGEC